MMSIFIRLGKVFLWLIVGMSIAGCYRSAKMNMQPLIGPWISPNSALHRNKITTKIPILQTLQNKQVIYHILHNNPRLRWLRLQHKSKLAAAQRFGLFSNPELRINGLSGALANGDVSQLNIRLRWAPPFPSVHAATQDRAYALVMASRQDAILERFSLLKKARKLYIQLLSFKPELHLEQARLKIKQKRQKWEEKRLKLGLSNVLKVTRKRFQVLQQMAKIRQLQTKQTQRQSELKVLLGVGGACKLGEEPFFTNPSQRTKPTQKWLKQALQHSPSLTKIRYLYRAAKASLWIEYTKRVPWFSYFQLSYGFGRSTWTNGFFLGVGIDLPVFNWNTGKIKYQKSQLRMLQGHARNLVKTLVMNVRISNQQWDFAQQTILNHHKKLQVPLKKNLSLADKTIKQAGSQPDQLWNIQEQVQQLKRTKIQHLKQLHFAQIDLESIAAVDIWTPLGIQLANISN